MKRNKSLLAFLGILLLIGIALGTLIWSRRTCQKLNCLSFPGRENFRLKELYQDDKNIYRALFSDKTNLLRVNVQSNIDSASAEKYIQGEITRMKALFANAVSPYPGEISNEIVCGKKFTPELNILNNDGLTMSYFTGYLNQRLVFGACTEDQAIYRGILALFYCPRQNRVFQLEIIVPKDEFSRNPQKYPETLRTMSCKN